MGIIEMKQQAGIILEDWNPFLLDKGNYEKEIIAVIFQLELLDDPSKLAKNII